MARPRVLVTTVPFAEREPEPLRVLDNAGVQTVINPLGRKLTERELAELKMANAPPFGPTVSF